MKEAALLEIDGDEVRDGIELRSGWNMLGYPAKTSMGIEEALSSITGKFSSVWTYQNNAWKLYAPHNPEFSDLTLMNPGDGYWINANENCTWTLPTHFAHCLKRVKSDLYYPF